MSESNKGKRYESDGEKGGGIGVEIEEAMKRWGEKKMEMWREREARFMASGWY